MERSNEGCRRTFLVILCIVLGLLLSLLIAGTVYANYLLNLMNRPGNDLQETMSQEQIEEILQEDILSPDATNAPVKNEEDLDWGNKEGELIETSENIVNILLIGQDARPGEGRARSDTMILVTVNKTTKTITMTSFLRDLYVKIPGYADNKLNATYVLGGMELLDKTLEQNFGVQVDGNVEVDFNCFARVVDELGGVEMELRSDEANYINITVENSNLTAGVHRLTGQQALQYSRIRHLDPDADFSRTNRQRKVINALLEQFRNTDVSDLLKLVKEILPMVTTDMSNKDILSLAGELLPMLADCTIVSQRVPADGEYYLATINQMSCIVADMDAARELLSQTFQD